jgi:high affinity choline transporter 7
VTSSFSSSILSASAMFSWNTCARLLAPQLPLARLQTIMRVTIGVIAVGAVWMALEVQSVQALWFFTSDLVFVLLFPQLVAALFDAKANVAGSMVAFTVSLVLRLGGGEPLFGVAPVIPYPEIASWLLPIDAARWYTEDGFLLFPYKSLAAVTGLVLLPVVSRATPSWSAPRALRNVAQVSR